MESSRGRDGEMVEIYDDEAEASGWCGPEVAFGFAYAYIQPKQSILDIGIGTGLSSVLFRKAGMAVHGMDISPEMLDACRSKGFSNLTLHDLTKVPYPYAQNSFDHVVCAGVLQFFDDLTPVFAETKRILRPEGLFVFVVGDRKEDECMEIVVGAEHTYTGAPVTMYRHSNSQICGWLESHGFVLLRDLGFTIYMDRKRTRSFQARAYLARMV